MRQLKLNALPKTAHIPQSLRYLVSSFYRWKQFIISELKKGIRTLQEMKFQWYWHFQTILWFTCRIWEILAQIWENLCRFPTRASTSFKNVVNIEWNLDVLFENTVLRCDQIVLWYLYRGTVLRLNFVILIWYLLC